MASRIAVTGHISAGVATVDLLPRYFNNFFSLLHYIQIRPEQWYCLGPVEVLSEQVQGSGFLPAAWQQQGRLGED